MKKATIEYFPPESEVNVPAPPVQEVKLPFTLPLYNPVPLGLQRNFGTQVSTVKPLQMPLYVNQSQPTMSTSYFGSKAPVSQAANVQYHSSGNTIQASGTWQQQCDPYSSNRMLMHASAVSSLCQTQSAVHRGSAFNAGHFTHYSFNPTHPVPYRARQTSSYPNQCDFFKTTKSELTHSQGKVELQTQWSPAHFSTGSTQDQLGWKTAHIYRKDIDEKCKGPAAVRLTKEPVVVSIRSPSYSDKPSQQPQPSTPTVRTSGSASCTVVHVGATTEPSVYCPPTSAGCSSANEEDRPMDLLSEYWRDVTESGMTFVMDESNTVAESTSEEFPPL